jgi:hypothetical protein|tara:strand:- start:1538 stop:1849 length:312 start_codon:yes stop_codon:yes gene_type:complete
MPIYNFRNIETDEVSEEIMSISARDAYLIANPQLKGVILSSPKTVSGVGEIHTKIDNGAKEVFQRIADANPHSPMNDKWGSDKSKKATENRNIVKKHFSHFYN